jgi:hypothetical protein
MYLGLERLLNEQPQNSLKYPFGPNLNTSGDGSDLFRSVAPIEMLCNSPNGSVVGYRRGEQGITADRAIDAKENSVFDNYVEHFQSGVQEQVPSVVDWVTQHGLASDEIWGAGKEKWSSLLSSPPRAVARAYSELNHNEQFGLGGFRDMSKEVLWQDWTAALTSREKFVSLVRKIESTGWPEGYLTACNVKSFWVLVTALKNLKANLAERRRN